MIDIEKYVNAVVEDGNDRYEGAGYPYAVGVLQAQLESLVNGDDRMREIVLKNIAEVLEKK